MLRTESNSELIDAVEQLEVSLEAPVVPGDMVSWATNVRQACEKLQPILDEQIREVHPRTIKQIAAEDPELSARAVNLKNEDEESLRQFERLWTWVSRLPKRVSEVEPDEGVMEDELKELIDEGLKFVLHVRRQETAIKTWMNESLFRDRGPVD